MPEYVRRYQPPDVRVVGNGLHHALNGTRAHAQLFMEREVSFDELARPSGDRDDPALAAAAIGASLAVYCQSVLLPVDLISRKPRELRDPQAGVEERPDHQPLRVVHIMHSQAGLLPRV